VTSRLHQFLTRSPYQQYVYGYPHKTAYRRFESPRPLEQVWASERKEARFLYVHIPFCEMRCGFCNLFTTVNPVETVVEKFLAQLEVEAAQTADVIGPATFTRAAIGGGTPTYLDAKQLERVMTLMRETMGMGAIPLSVELSPSTVTADKLEVLSQATRLSLGVQSFVEAEVAAVKRPQANGDVTKTLDLIRARSKAHLNIDLIYGMEGQTESSFIGSLETALRWRPEELYLYPLYVRPLTFLGKRAASWDDHRVNLYRAGRDWLTSHGYVQRSMRVFQRRDVAELQRRSKDAQTGIDERIRKLEPIGVTLDDKQFLADPEEKRQYDEAFALIRKGDFAAASAGLSGFLKRYPLSGYVDSATFWLGNAQYGQRQYKEAIASFRSLLARDPAHPKAPEAMLAIANCQIELKDSRAARKTIGELVQAYPKSEAAQAGRERLASLK